MTLIEDIKKLESWEIATAIGCFLVTVAPGFLVIYVYKPTLIKELETVKLIILSLSLTLPVIAINTLLSVLITASLRILKSAKNKTDLKSFFLFMQIVLAFVVLYGALLATYLFSFTFKEFLIATAVLDVIGIILLSILLYKYIKIK